MTVLDLNKAVRTRDGQEVQQLTVFNNTTMVYTLSGVVDGDILTWTKDGVFDARRRGESPLDLVNVTPSRIKQGVYMRVYKDGYLGVPVGLPRPKVPGSIGYIYVDIDAEIIPYQEDN